MALPLVILGTGGAAHDILDIVNAINRNAQTWQVVGFLDDARTPGSRHLGFPILGPLWTATRHNHVSFVNAIGSDQTCQRRPGIISECGVGLGRFATLVHPMASVSSRARIGRGVCVNFGVSVGGGASIGNHVTLCQGAIVGHDTNVDDYAALAPGAVVSGFVYVGKASYVGAAASIRQWVRIGEGAVVGMGAVVVKDVPPGATVVGNPAEIMVSRRKELAR